jgi:hypothetical protein
VTVHAPWRRLSCRLLLMTLLMWSLRGRPSTLALYPLAAGFGAGEEVD